MFKIVPKIVVPLIALCSITFSQVVITETVKVKKDVIETDLVNILSVDSSIKVDLKYSTNDNFVGKDIYKDLDICYLRAEVAQKLVISQNYLKELHPNYSLIVYDGLRPRSVQWNMWNLVKGTKQQKYVGNPKNGSIHNYGAAVDLSIIDETGKPLDMGTKFDYFGKLAQPKLEAKFLKQGKLTKEHIANRKLLRKVMKKGGFTNISIEWWHFNAYSRKVVKEKFGVVENIEILGK